MLREQRVAFGEIGVMSRAPLHRRSRVELNCKVATKLCLVEHEDVLLGLSSS